MTQQLEQALAELLESLNAARNVDLSKPFKKLSLTDYKSTKKEYYQSRVQTALTKINQAIDHLPPDKRQKVKEATNKLIATTDPIEITKIVNSFTMPKNEERENKTFTVKANIPEEITDPITADLTELEKCFISDCYRSCIVLCGRILETALHRKYYEVTNNDLLEKAPGIGLGNLIAKLAEKEIKLDPGLSNQIHLINQVRIYSVHTKQNQFTPTKGQAHAIILYTIDILEKLFT
jgi:hypothetical protein